MMDLEKKEDLFRGNEIFNKKIGIIDTEELEKLSKYLYFLVVKFIYMILM